MQPTWKEIYPWIKTALLNLESVDSLLRQVVEKIASVYEAECLLWAGLEMGVSDALRVYGLSEVVNKYAANFAVEPPLDSDRPSPFQPDSVQPFVPRSLPSWLLDQQNSPQIIQLETGELIIPISSRGNGLEDPRGRVSVANPLQFVLQLRRSFAGLPVFAPPSPLSSFPFRKETAALPIQGWNVEELESLEVVCSHVGLAYSALYWRERLEQSRQQAALIGRISRLLNSTLNPDEVVGRIVAELGYGLQCDRSILVDLRDSPATILAVWDYPERQMVALEERHIYREYWQNIIELFMQGGASYLQMGVHAPEADLLQDWMRSIGVMSVLLVPLFIQEEFFGAVALLSYQQERAYLLDELQTVRQVADQAAIALTNAQNYQRLWRRQVELRMQNDSLQQEILRDDLTQLMNRRSLEWELEQLSMAAVWTVQSPFSVIVCDIDYFKMVNDAYGHLVGDEVLVELSKRVQDQLRRGTPAYRYGGEEFVVILTETPLDQAIDVAERLRRAVRGQSMPTKAGELDITASFGVAQQNSATDRTAWDVLQRADKALYEAKRQGRDRVQVM
ncbi:MAG: sensor domain-containing diguanylate cyclase [Drouetiella hepatica Uher 2000/2452]|jgi:diguanylate cyclase (GGDEF)-like protein|uniref:Sensor domain-containing diguanylate cyclase n=1 Tax=Drouetiella hepatica Uher 2000/2452 TaxID=904376 RepID=A0A951UKM4_9CYAN|nr:sensor domain-containing diguanylate cyclase [Drouetiella hepatica Uher 2000/2452]